MFATRRPDKAVFDTSKFKHSVLLYMSNAVFTTACSLHMAVNRPPHGVSNLLFYFDSNDFLQRISVNYMAVFMEMNANTKHMTFQLRRARFWSDSFVLIGQEH